MVTRSRGASTKAASPTTPRAASRASGVTLAAAVAPPHAQAPAPPGPSAPLDRRASARLKHATDTQVAAAPLVAQQLRGSSTYTQDFGEDAPNAEALSTALETLAAWQQECARADKWQQYAHTQKSQAGHAAMTLVEQFQTEWNHALAHRAELASRYPSVPGFLGVRAEVGKRAAATRRAKKKAAGNGKG